MKNIVRVPPYAHEYTFADRSGDIRLQPVVSNKRQGNLDIRGGGRASSSSLMIASFGFSCDPGRNLPPNSYMTVDSSPSIQFNWMSGGMLGGNINLQISLGLAVAVVDKTNHRFRRWAVYQQYIVLYRRYGYFWVPVETNTVRSSEAPLSARFPIDNAHYYGIHFHLFASVFTAPIAYAGLGVQAFRLNY